MSGCNVLLNISLLRHGYRRASGYRSVGQNVLAVVVLKREVSLQSQNIVRFVCKTGALLTLLIGARETGNGGQLVNVQ